MMPTPGMLPTSIVTLALAVCGGSFHFTVPVFVIFVPSSRVRIDDGAEAQQRRLLRLQRPIRSSSSRP